MAEENQEQQEQQEQQESTGSGSPVGTGTAVKAVAAAAATGAAALAAKKMMSGRSSNGQASNGDSPQKQDQGESLMSSVLAGGWEAARDALLPAAEDAAGAAGEYVAQHGPDILRDRIVPRFVDSFNEARGGS
jgi:hypothetical protein